jgi:Homeodomain-like domain
VRLVQGDEDAIRQVIHRFNEMGLAGLDPQWAGGRPRRISPEDEAFIVETANARPETCGQPFSRWSLRTLSPPTWAETHTGGCTSVVNGNVSSCSSTGTITSWPG